MPSMWRNPKNHANCGQHEVRGTAVRESAGGADDVDVAESEEPRKLWAIISVSEDEVRGTAVRKSAGGADDVDVSTWKGRKAAAAEPSINSGRLN